ncbi:RidA family protein [Vibrio sp. WXL103]|uniref:RidA family protein n=1 Tax=Vibrio sp. WXL103 TaxID=3450710 RepID=UPI003EC8B42A
MKKLEPTTNFKVKLALTGLALMSCNVQAIERINPPSVIDTTPFGFSQAVIAPSSSKSVFVSGQFAGTRKGQLVDGGMEAQMDQAFANLEAVIEATGAMPEQTVQIRVLIVDHREAYLDPLEKRIAALFGSHLPASTLIPVPRLALDGMLFEIEATLLIPENTE